MIKWDNSCEQPRTIPDTEHTCNKCQLFLFVVETGDTQAYSARRLVLGTTFHLHFLKLIAWPLSVLEVSTPQCYVI